MYQSVSDLYVYCKLKWRELTSTCTHKHKSYTATPPRKQMNTYRLLQNVSDFFLTVHFLLWCSQQKSKGGAAILICVLVCKYEACAHVCVRAPSTPAHPRHDEMCQTGDCQRLNLISYSLAAPPSPSIPIPSSPFPLPLHRKSLIYFAWQLWILSESY